MNIETDSYVRWVDDKLCWEGDDRVAMMSEVIIWDQKPGLRKVGQRFTVEDLDLQLVWTQKGSDFFIYVGHPGIRSKLISTKYYLLSACDSLKAVILRICELWGCADTDPRCVPSWRDLRWPFGRKADA